MRTLITALIVLSAAACDKKDPAPAAPAPAPAGEAAKPASARPAIVDAYDAVREALATDDLAATQATSKKLAEAAQAEAPIAQAASAVAAAADLEVARKAFGDLSKLYIELLTKKPELNADKSLIAFRCPMAEGYQKWVQLAEPMRNPYMGKRMLECGSKVELTP